MMADALQAVHDKIAATGPLMAALAGLYSGRAPQAADANVNAPFPYVVISGVTAGPWNTKGEIGQEALVQVDLYARSQSDKAVYALAGMIRSALERQPLTLDGWVDTVFVNAVPGFEDDGKTRRIILDFRVTSQQEAA
jgi:hypothetical protein